MNLNYSNEKERLKIKNYFIENINRIDKKKPTILLSTPSETGTSYFRLLEPLIAMYKKYPNKFNYIYTENFDSSMFNIADIVIQHRASPQHTKMVEWVKQLPSYRKKPIIIHDVDDNEMDIPKTHPLYQMWIETKKDKMSEKQIKESDYITTTANELKKIFKRINKNSNSKIYRNMFNWELPMWNINTLKRKDDKDKIVIGWAGLTSHMQDIKKMHKFLKRIYDKFPNTYFILSGMPVKNVSTKVVKDPNTGESRIVESSEVEVTYKDQVKEIYKDFSKDRIEFQDVKPLSNYGEFYTQYDIGLAYVEHNKFNKCKSEIKVVEYAKYGALPLFTKFGGYDDFFNNLPADLKNNDIAMFINTELEWENKLTKILNNFDDYSEYRKKLQKYVTETYDINKNIDNRVNFYESLLSKQK